MPASPFELFAEDRTIAVCKDKRCNRLHDALPPGTHDVSGSIVNATGTQVFVYHGDDTASTFDVRRDRRLAQVDFRWGEGPPPPTSSNDLVYFGRGILIGDFEDEGIIDRAVDPITGHRLLLEKPWARLPGDLLVHFEAGLGAVDLVDFDAHLAIVAKRRAGKPHQPTEAVIGSIVNVGANALVVTQDPPATLFVDSKRRTISRSRALPLCP